MTNCFQLGNAKVGGSNALFTKLHQKAGIHLVGCAEGNVSLQAKPTKRNSWVIEIPPTAIFFLWSILLSLKTSTFVRNANHLMLIFMNTGKRKCKLVWTAALKKFFLERIIENHFS